MPSSARRPESASWVSCVPSKRFSSRSPCQWTVASMSPSFSTSTSTSEPCGNPQRRAGDGAVVGEHPHGRVADALGHRRDAQREPVAVGELDDRGGGRGRQAGRLARELICRNGHPVSLWFRGATKPSRPSTALEDPRRAVRRAGGLGARAPTCRPYARQEWWRKLRPSNSARAYRRRRLRRIGPMRPGPRDRAEDGGDQRRLGLVFRHAPGAQLRAGGVDERHEHRQMPAGAARRARKRAARPARAR